MKLLSSVLLFSTSAKAFSSPSFVRTTLRPAAAAIQTRLMSSSNKPFAVIVEAEILPERMDEFLKLIKTNAENTRKEPGCLRFDVLRSKDDPNKFFFYEVYTKVEDIEYHKQQAHYSLWADFKASGGVVNSVTHKTDGEFMT